MPDETRPTWRLTVVALRSRRDPPVPPTARLRQALKHLLRALDLRVTLTEEIPAKEEGGTPS